MGVLDSLAFVELVEEMQSGHHIVVRDVDITRDNFASIAAMASYIQSRRGA
jgi:acyl carrier protein